MLDDVFDVFSTETLLAMMGRVPADYTGSEAYGRMANLVGERLAFSKFSDEVLEAKMTHPNAGLGFVREAEILLRCLVKPSDRAEASKRAWGLMNVLGTNYSHAVHLAAQDVLNGRPEFKPTFPLTEPMIGA